MANLKTGKKSKAKKTEETEVRSLDELATALIEAHEAKGEYNPVRLAFFDALTRDVEENEELPEERFTTPDDVTEADVLKEYPDHEVISKEETDDEIAWVVRKDPALIKRTFVVKELGMVVGRNVSKGRDWLDNEEFLQYHPEHEDLYEDTYQVSGDVVKAILEEAPEMEPFFTHMGRKLSEDRVNDKSEEHPELVSEMEDHTYPGKSSIRIMTPRQAKPEELE